MPLRRNDQLWANLPGIVAAYQPVRAPGPLLARYNMAAGGQSRYMATVGGGLVPVWNPITGWRSLRTRPWLATGIAGMTVGAGGWSMLVQFRNAVSGGGGYLCGYYSGVSNSFAIYPTLASKVFYTTNSDNSQSPELTAGHLAIAGATGYRNGLADKALAGTGAVSGTITLCGSGTTEGADANILAVAIYSRTLSAVEMWTASRQMAYCDVNPEWSVWGRRRQWFYGPQVGGFQAAWARGANTVIQAGSR